MNRLTRRTTNCPLPVLVRDRAFGPAYFVSEEDYTDYRDALEKLARYEDTGLEPEQCAKYAQAEKEGRLLVLPCKVGDTVYIVDRGEILEEKVIGFFTFNKKSFNKKSGEPVTAMTASYGHYVTQPNINAIGVLNGENQLSFFFTREDAEKALEGTKNDE